MNKKVSAKKKVAVFDIDGTIFRNSLLIELHWAMVKAGIIPRSAIRTLDKKYWDWVTRKRSYEEYMWEVVSNFDEFVGGQSVSGLQRLARNVVKAQSNIVYRYTRDLIQKLSKTHILIAISGSPKAIVEEFTKAWKFDYYVATIHDEDKGYYTGKKSFIGYYDKEKTIRALCKQHGLSLANSIGVGDSKSDIGIFSAVASPICFNPTSELYAIAKRKKWKVVVERKDMIYKF